MYEIIIAVTSFVSVFLGYLSIRKDSKSATNILLALLTFLFALWSITNYFSLNSSTEELTLFWIRIVMFFTSYLGPVIFLLLTTYPSRKLGVRERSLWIIIIASVATSITSILPITFSKVAIVEGTITPTVGPGIAMFGILLMFTILGGIRNVYVNYRSSTGFVRAQMRLLLVGSVLTFSLQILTNVVLVIAFKQSGFVVLGPSFSLILLGVMFYSIARYRFLDIRVTFRFVLIRSLAVLFLGLLMYFILNISIRLFNSDGPISLVLGSIVGSGLFVLIYNPLNNFIKDRFDEYFFVKERRKEELLANAIAILSKYINLDSILEEIRSSLKQNLDIQKIKFVLVDYADEIYWSGDEWQELDTTEVLSIVQDISETTLVGELIRRFDQKDYAGKIKIQEINALKNFGVELIVPITYQDEFIGYLLLSTKSGDDVYSNNDVEIIESIALQTGIVIKNSILYEETKKFNQTLQLKIDEATKELEARYQELREIRAKERDMMDIMGHELRTPLSIIKISMGALDIVTKKSPEKFSLDIYKPHARKMKDAILREIELLETMLTSTKIDARRLELTFEKVVMNDLVEDAILGHKQQIEDKKLQVTFEGSDKEYFAYADKVRLSEVVDNLVNNGIKYTEEGSVKIKIDDSDPEMLNVTITDTGIGIPKEALSRLGEKFYRVRQYVNGDAEKNGKRLANVVRPGGTGLGLYVTFGLIKMMGGEVHVESELGKGSVFSFKIPKFTGQKETEVRNSSKDIFQRMGLAKGEKPGVDKDQADKA